MAAKSMTELGQIMLAHYSREQLESGYAHDCTDPMMVGLSALQWGDISSDGSLT